MIGTRKMWRSFDLYHQEKYNDSLQAYNRALELDLNDFEAWYNIGVIYLFKGHYQTAVQKYKKATQINPAYQKALVRRNVDTDLVMSRSLSCACQDPIIF